MKRGMFKVIATALSALLIAGVVFYLVSSQDDLDELERIHSNWASWPTVHGVITFAKTASGTNPNGETYYRLNTRFGYEVESTLYFSTQSWYVGGPGKERQYLPGAKVTVHYDPLDPKTAVIEPEKVLNEWVLRRVKLYMSAILISLGGCGFVWGMAYTIAEWLARRRNSKCAKS